MTYIIAEPCVDVKDGACVDVCPVDCIYGLDIEEDRMLYISPDECIGLRGLRACLPGERDLHRGGYAGAVQGLDPRQLRLLHG